LALTTGVVKNRDVATCREADVVVVSGVLLVNEDLKWLREASDCLQRAGCYVVPALSGATALHHINEGIRPAVLVAALKMSGIGGTELSRVVCDVSPRTGLS
jgi:DNA-binding NtrC family response regulator